MAVLASFLGFLGFHGFHVGFHLPALTKRQRYWLQHIRACEVSGKSMAEYAASQDSGRMGCVLSVMSGISLF